MPKSRQRKKHKQRKKHRGLVKHNAITKLKKENTKKMEEFIEKIKAQTITNLKNVEKHGEEE